MKIVFTGGGTGGHIIPIIAVAREIRRMRTEQEAQFFYIGPKDDFSEMLLEQERIPAHRIMAGKIRRYLKAGAMAQNAIDLFFRIPFGFLQAFWKLYMLAPDLIFSKGGYGALEVVLAGRIFGIPVLLHESDVVPGLSNRIAGKFVSQIFVSFPRTRSFPAQKMIVVGNPIRKELLSGSKEEGKRLMNLKGDKPVVLVMGGSQGAQRINDMALVILNDALKEFEIVHQTGEKNFKEVAEEAKVVVESAQEPYYHPVAFFKETDLRHVYAAADFIVNRAGAGSIFEIAALGKPSILVPLPESAQGHQIQNAYEYAATGAGAVLEETNLTPRFFLEKLRYYFSHSEELAKMSQAALAFAKPDAASTIARVIIEHLAKYDRKKET